MLKLGETITRLARHRRLWNKLVKATGAQQSDVHRIEPAWSRLTEVTGFGSNPGALRMFAYVPKHLEPSPALVVVLHGCTQSAASYDYGAGWSTLADRYGFVLLMPQQQHSNNLQGCFNWFQPGDTERGQGEALSIRQMVERMILDHGIDRRRVFVTGLSAGGAMTSVMLATYPDVFAGGAIIAGLPYRTATNVQEAFESMFEVRARPAREWGDRVREASQHTGPWPRVSVWHGGADATVKPANAGEIIKQWTDVHGLPAAATAEDTIDGYPRRLWRNAAGETVIESYTITGMAHGTPLATGNADGQCGVAGAFLIEAGISSSYRIAKFWGLTASPRSAAVEERELASIVPEQPYRAREASEAETTDAGPEPVYPARSLPIDIQAVITKALTAAGLMRPRP